MPLTRFPLKYQLLLIIAIIALPAICLLVSSEIKQRRSAILIAEMETQKLVAAIVSEQDNLVKSTLQLFIALSQSAEVRAHKQIEVQSLFSKILKQSPSYTNIFIADLSGNVWASAVPLTEAVTVADRRYFQNALASGRLSSGEFLIARTSKKPSLTLGYPLKDEAGKVVGVLCAGLSMGNYCHILDEYNLPQGASFTIIDHKGIILTRSSDPVKYMGRPANKDVFRHMVEGPDEETLSGLSDIGGNSIQTYRKLRLEGESTPYLYVRAGISSDTVISAANAALRKNLLLYSSVLVIGILISWRIGRKCIIDRVLFLERSSQRLAEGDLNIRVSQEVQEGELGQLGQSIDNMAQRITESAHENQRKADEFRAIIQTTLDGFNICDRNGKIIDANDSYAKMLGYDIAELKTMNITAIEAIENPDKVAAHIDRIINTGSDLFISRHKRKDGTEIDVEITTTYLDYGGGQFYSFVRDITERKRLEAELLRAATKDSLTGVFNRMSLEKRVVTELKRSKRYGNIFSLIMFDIDDFKSINDTLGHLAGDKVLKDIAQVVKGNIRNIDSVGRWGGEEFMIVLSETNASEAAKVAEKLRLALAEHGKGEAVQVTASFGVTTCQADDTLDTILKRVDDLMYSVKNSGKNSIAL